MWNKTWVPTQLLPCVANSCPIIPFPPKFTGLLFEPDEESSFSVVSEFAQYSPKIPSLLPVPQDFCIKEGTIAMAVGIIHSDKPESSADFVFKTDDGDEAYHVEISLGLNTVYRYAVQNGTFSDIHGNINDDTTIDLDEPFTIKMHCDGDGWVAKINEEKSFLHFLHVVPFQDITQLEVSGDLDVSFLGIGDEKMTPAPQMGFNITYKCPPGQLLLSKHVITFLFCSGEVFDSDWYATPFILMTCMDNGLFDSVEDWEPFKCSLRKDYKISFLFWKLSFITNLITVSIIQFFSNNHGVL